MPQMKETDFKKHMEGGGLSGCTCCMGRKNTWCAGMPKGCSARPVPATPSRTLIFSALTEAPLRMKWRRQ